ncbi:UNVERIFIED_CONTAM: hypothetical protein HDU68_006162, partial [Siphonaria sp. JEL0065]
PEPEFIRLWKLAPVSITFIPTAILKLPFANGLDFKETKTRLRISIPSLVSFQAVDDFFAILMAQSSESDLITVKSNTIASSVHWFKILDTCELRDRPVAD